MATILQLKVAKRRLFEKVSLEPCNRINYEELRDGAYGLSSLSEKTTKSNHLQMPL